MEGHDSLEISISGGTGGASRWNPTKEQIDMLENLYKQGLRTPSAEQIQQITNRLRSFGHIEGKNVFYWFQNHKARQRQKQKQDHVSYVNRFLHKPVYSPCPNVVCNPFYMARPETRLCNQQPPQPKLLLPRNLKRRTSLMAVAETIEKNKPCGSPPPAILHPSKYSEDCMNGRPNNKETLELFPMQPSGNLLQSSTRTTMSSPNYLDPMISSSSSMGNSAAFSSSIPFACVLDHHQGVSEEDHTFFDFLCGNGSCDP